MPSPRFLVRGATSSVPLSVTQSEPRVLHPRHRDCGAGGGCRDTSAPGHRTTHTQQGLRGSRAENRHTPHPVQRPEGESECYVNCGRGFSRGLRGQHGTGADTWNMGVQPHRTDTAVRPGRGTGHRPFTAGPEPLGPPEQRVRQNKRRPSAFKEAGGNSVQSAASEAGEDPAGTDRGEHQQSCRAAGPEHGLAAPRNPEGRGVTSDGTEANCL